MFIHMSTNQPTVRPTDCHRTIHGIEREWWRNRLVLFRIFGKFYLTAKATKNRRLGKIFFFLLYLFYTDGVHFSLYIHRWSTIISVLTASFALKVNNSRWEMEMDMIMIIIQFSQDGMDESRPISVLVYVWLHSHRLN